MKEKDFLDLVASVREGGAILRGETPPSRAFRFQNTDIKRLRNQFNLSQSQFAALLGIRLATLRNWEQGRRRPEGPARVLLQVVAKHPEAVWDSIHPPSRPRRKKSRVAAAG